MIRGTQAGRYLAERLGVAENDFPEDDWGLRFDPLLLHSSTKRFFPAMLGAVRAAPGADLHALHRTYLHPDSHCPQKAPVDNPKMLMARPGTGGVWLTDIRPRMFVGEGIETTLSALVAVGGGASTGAVAALSTSGLLGLVLPDAVREVVVLVDVDEPDPKNGLRPGEAAAQKFAERMAGDGRTVRLAFPGARDGAKCDFNDMLLQEGRAAVRAAIDAAEPFVSNAAAKLNALVADALRDAAPVGLPANVHRPRMPMLDLSELPTLEAEQARLRGVLAGWARAAVRHMAWAGMDEQAKRFALRDLERRHPELIGADRLPHDDRRRRERTEFVRAAGRLYTKAWTKALRHARWARDAPSPETTVIRATPGLGKTHIMMEVLADEIRRAPVPILVPWLVPEYVLAGEAVDRFKQRGIECAILLGREQDGMCERKDLVRPVAALGMSVRATLCQRPGMEPCPARFTCGYFKQADTLPECGAVIGTHHALRGDDMPGSVKLRADGWLGPVVVDESPSVALAGKQVDGDVTELRGFAREAEQDERLAAAAPLLHAIADLLERADTGGLAWRADLESRGFTLAQIEDAAGAVRDTLERTAGLPDNEGAIRRQVHKARELKPRRAALAAMEAVALDWRMGRSTLATVRAWSEPNGARKYRVLPPPVLEAGQLLSALILDASANQAIYEALLGRPVRFERFDIEPALVAVQITKPSFSLSAMGIRKRALGAAPPTAEQEADWQQVRDMALHAVRVAVLRHGRGKVLVVVPKALRELWTGTKDPKGITAWDAEGCLIGHFNALRGQDSARGCEAVVVIGRTLPPRQAIEDEARGTFVRDPEPLIGLLPADADEASSQFDKGRRPLQMRGGGGLEIDTWVHDDWRVEACLTQKVREEVVQAIHRIRPAQAGQGAPKYAYILSSVAHDMTIDRVMEFYEWRRTMDMERAARAGPLAVEPRALKEHAPSVVSRRDGTALGERATQERVAEMTQGIISISEWFRRVGHCPHFSNKNYSIWENAGAPFLCGFLSAGEQVFRLGMSGTPIPKDNQALSEMFGCKISANVDMIACTDEANAGSREKAAKEMSDSMVELQKTADALGHLGHRKPEGPAWERYKTTFQRSRQATESFLETLNAEELRDLLPTVMVPAWPAERMRSTTLVAHSLADILDPFVDDARGVSFELPDGRRLLDHQPEAERLHHLLRAIEGQGSPIPADLTARPFVRALMVCQDKSRRAA